MPAEYKPFTYGNAVIGKEKKEFIFSLYRIGIPVPSIAVYAKIPLLALQKFLASSSLPLKKDEPEMVFAVEDGAVDTGFSAIKIMEGFYGRE